MRELRPGVFTEILTRVAVEGDRRTRAALAETARGMEGAAKSLLTQTSHPYGTPTSATPGGPPGLVSGTLRRAVTHTPIRRVGIDYETLVGPARGFHPPYPHRSRYGRAGDGRTVWGPPKRTDAATYGRYLETGLRNGARYPWLSKAFRFGVDVLAPAVWKRTFTPGPW